MTQIIPAIIAQNLEEIREKIKLVEPYVDWVQLDVLDGIFAPSKTFNNPLELKNLQTDIKIEAHLMIDQPELVIDEWILSGVKRILIHYESTQHLDKVIDKIKAAGLEVGVVLKMATPIIVIDNLINKLDVIQLMGIAEIGYYGHSFDEQVLEKISALRKKYPHVIIEIDGGINLVTAQKVIERGAQSLVVGSYLFQGGQIKERIDLLRNLFVLH